MPAHVEESRYLPAFALVYRVVHENREPGLCADNARALVGLFKLTGVAMAARDEDCGIRRLERRRVG